MNNAFDEILLHEIHAVAIPMILIILPAAVVIALFRIRYYKERQKKDGIAYGVVSAGLVITCIVIFFAYLVPLSKDVKNQSYIKYEGTFYTTGGEFDYRTGSRPTIQFDDQTSSERFNVKCKKYLPDGKHEGYIIYSKRSKFIVDWHCDSCPDN